MLIFATKMKIFGWSVFSPPPFEPAGKSTAEIGQHVGPLTINVTDNKYPCILSEGLILKCREPAFSSVAL